MSIFLLFVSVMFLAYWNGANDNFKGVATLYGSGTVNYRTAISIATIATFAGSICAIFIAQGLVSSFSGKGLVPNEVASASDFLIAVGFGAACTVLLATRFGLPISTTHSLVGGLFGAGLMSVGAEVNFSLLGKVFFIPLFLSPFIAFSSALLVYWIFTTLRKKMGITKESCICIGSPRAIIPITSLDNPELSGLSVQQKSHITDLTLTVAKDQECMTLYSGQVAGIYLQKILDYCHIVSAAAVSFARGLNDTPKITGLLVAAQVLNINISMIVIALAMAVGGLLNAKKVAETMSKKITTLSHSQGFSANLITAILVIFASKYGVPVSTTHVSVGSIFGISMVKGERDKRIIREILLSWLGTLPMAMAFSALIFWLLNLVTTAT